MPEMLTALMGISLFLALHNLWVWIGLRSDWRYLWVGLWCANSFFYQWSRYSQLTADTPGELFRADRAAFTSAVLVIVAVLMMSRQIAVPQRSRWFGPIVTAAAAVILAIHWTGEWFITSEVSTFSGWFGRSVQFSTVGPLYLPFLVVCSTVLHVYGVLMFLKAPNLEPRERWGFIFGITVYLGFGLNDVLLYSGIIETTSLFEYGFAAVAVSLNVVVVHYVHLVQDSLQEAVKKKTEELTDALDQARAASRAKDRFLANISHELRTPLNGVVVALEVLTGEEVNPTRADLLRLASNSADSLLSLIDEILQIARIDTDTFHVREVNFSLRGWLAEVLRQNSAEAHKKGLEIMWDVASDVPDAVCGDRDHLRKILTNLVGNAVKFTDSGTVTVEVRLNLAGRDDVVLEFKVSDTGPGIPQHLFGTIFERFSRGDESLTRRHGGVGLGLAICREIVVRLGGQIWVESEVGVGSIFRFTMPIKLSGQGLPDEARDLANMRVLVVGPEPSAATLAAQLSRRGLIATAISSPDEASEVPAADLGGTAEAVVLFADASDIDDLSLVKKVRENPHTAAVGVVLLGRLHGGDLLGEGEDFGPDVCLTRPVDPQTLLGALRTLHRREDRSKKAVERIDNGVGAGLRVLVADDNEVNLKVARVLLEGMGHAVYTVTNGEEALEILGAEVFDVVLMDVQMPVMDGLEATRRLRADLPTERQPRVVAVTAASSDKDKRRCLAAGMDDFLAKPIGVAELRNTLVQHSEVVAGPDGPRDAMQEITLDYSVLEEIKDLETDDAGGILADIITSFGKAARIVVRDFGQHFEGEDLEAVRRAAHSLKGASRQVGAMVLGRLCSRLERAVARNQLLDARELVAQIETELEDVISALDEVLQSPHQG